MQHFLLIDDDDVFAALLQRRFSARGLTLDWLDGAAALDAYQGIPQGIVLDLNLDGDSGLRLLPLLRQRFADSRIVVLTGYASISTAVEAVKLGAWQYLPKPADTDSLLQAFGLPSENLSLPVSEDVPSLQRLKWEHIQFVLQQNGGNISATARALNMHRRTLQRMLAKHPVKQ